MGAAKMGGKGGGEPLPSRDLQNLERMVPGRTGSVTQAGSCLVCSGGLGLGIMDEPESLSGKPGTVRAVLVADC